LKSKHKIHVILETEDQKTIRAQEEIWSQIVKKEMSLLRLQRRGPITLKKLFHTLITIKPKSQEPERAFSATGLFVTKLRNRLNHESVL